MMRGRQFWVIAHRWAGLTIALLLTVAGVTGSLLAFIDEIEPMTAPHVFRTAPPAPNAEPLDPLELREQALSRYPGAVIDYLPLYVDSSRSFKLIVEKRDPQTGAAVPWSTEWDELFVEPYTGEEVGRRKWGDITQGAVNLLPFIYKLHFRLSLGSWGDLALGIAALIWTLDCFVGLCLTLPPKRKRVAGAVPAGGTAWWQRWQPSWRVRWGSSAHKINFDLHRAGALWLWPLLLVFAWSSVSLNLPQVYDPVMRLFGYERISDGITPPAGPRHEPKIDFNTAATLGARLAGQEMARLGLALDPARASALFHRPDAGVYAYIFSSSADFRRHGGRSLVIFDSDTGRLVKLVLPQGQNGAFTFTEWITALHMAAVWGLPYRIAVSLLGLMVTMLSVTGVLIWTKKRSARLQRLQ